jgi:hypothetical protein
MEQKKPLKMYVLVRDDLETTYRGVQGIHAVAQYYEQGNTTDWHNSTVVQLAVRNEQALKNWQWLLSSKHKKAVAFREPDLNDQITAIACIDTGEIFKKLPLAR